MINNGTYGTVKPSLITSNDVDIFYFYKPTRSTDDASFTTFKKLSSSLLSTMDGTDDSGNTFKLAGMYNLKLPIDSFGKAGIYTIYIKPKEYAATIIDVSTLTAYSNIRGIVINSSDIDTNDASMLNNGGLVGYRVEYFDDQGNQKDIFRIITSSNHCRSISQNLNTSSSDGTTYSFNDASNLLFCTVTPSAAMSFNSNELPYIGTSNEKIKLVSTKFNPICLEIEMTEHDVEDVATMLEGNQLRNLNHGLITTFNGDGEIYHQANYGRFTNNKEGIFADFKINNNSSNVQYNEKEKMEFVKEESKLQ